MKKIVKNRKLISSSLIAYFVMGLLVGLYLINSEVSIFLGVLLYLLTCFLGYLFFRNDFYLFEYDNELIIVKNTWKPNYEKQFQIKKIKTIELGFVIFKGTTIFIHTEDKTFSYPLGVLSRKEIEEMIDFFNVQKTK